MRDAPPPHRVMEAADRAEARSAGTGGEGARRGRGQLSSMDMVPEEGQEDIHWAISELNKRERTQKDILFDLNDRLTAKGIDPISSSAFNRKSVALAAMSNRLNDARHIFQGIAPQFTAEKVDQSTVVLGEFLKLLVLELVQADGGQIGTKGVMELARAHLAVIQGQKLSAERRTKLEAEARDRLMKAAETAVGEVEEAGKPVDGAAVLKKIREDVYGIFER